MPEAGMECVVLVQYSEDDEPFTAIAKYELQKEDSLGREIGEAEYACGWNDYFECDVLAWFPVPSYSGIKLSEKTMAEENAKSTAPVHAVVSDETYYRERFELLIAWLEKNEQLHEAEAEADLNSDQRESARKNLAVASMAKRTRMWIRNRVTFSR